MIGLKVVGSCNVTSVNMAIQALRWLVDLTPRKRAERLISLKPKLRQISHRAIHRKPKKAVELLDVENSHTTGAKPTNSRANRAMELISMPITVWKLTSIPDKQQKM